MKPPVLLRPIGMERFEQEHSITCGELDQVITGAQLLLRTLRKTNHDFQLTRRGYELVYGLDFSELFTFLWPERSPRQNRTIVSRLLARKNLNFTLPPGSILELFRSLSRFSHDSTAARRRYLELAAQPFVASLTSQVLAGADLPADIQDLLYRRFLTDVGDLSDYGGFLGRLTHLSEISNLRYLDDYVGGDIHLLRPDRTKLREALSLLAINRDPRRDHNNWIDAHNYAMMFSLSESQYDSHYKRIFFLTTSSPIPYSQFRKIKWSRFPDIIKDPDLPETSLVRHPIHAFYLSLLLDSGPTAGQELRYLIGNLATVLRRLAALPAYDEYVRSKRKNPETIARLPRDRQFVEAQLRFRARYHNLFGEARRAIEADLAVEQNIRYRSNVSFWSIGAGVPDAWADEIDFVGKHAHGPSKVHAFFDQDRTLGLFDRIHSITLLVAKRLMKTIARFPADVLYDVDVEGIIVKRKPPQISWRWDEDFECYAGIATRVVGARLETIAFVDVFDSYMVTWWPTTCTIVDFISACRVLAEGADRTDGLLPPGPKAYTGISLIGEEDLRRHISLDDPWLRTLQTEDLVEAASAMNLNLVRIALPMGDLWYDFVPQRGDFQRMGIVTHCPASLPIADYLLATSEQRLSPAEAGKVVTAFVQKLTNFAPPVNQGSNRGQLPPSIDGEVSS